jgi:hypothetical protein
MRSTDLRGIENDPAPEGSLSSEAIERVRIGADSTVVSHDFDDSFQGLGHRCVTMDLNEGFTIMNPDTDFESWLTSRQILHNATHFETDDLSADNPVFEHDFGARVENQ